MNYTYRIVYSSRKTIGVEITPDGIVLVRAPKGTSNSDIEYILRKHDSEIMADLKDMRARVGAAETKAGPGTDFCERYLEFCGTEIKYKIVFGDVDRSSVKVDTDLSVVVTVPKDFSVWEAEDFAERHKRWIVNRLGEMKGRLDPLLDVSNGENVIYCGGRKVPYKVEFSSRKSVSVRINDLDMSVIVCVPYGTPSDVIEDTLMKSRNWISSNLSELDSRHKGFEDVLNYREILVSGKKYLLVCPAPCSMLLDDALYLRNLGSLMSFLVGEFGDDFKRTAYGFAKKFGVSIRNIDFRSYKTSLGNCDNDKNIVFNYKLLMLPRKYQEFVSAYLVLLVSERAETPEFWKKLESAVPGSKSMHESIHRYDFILSLYP